MAEYDKIIGSTKVGGVALVMRCDEDEQSFELSWDGNGLSGSEPFDVAEDAGKGWSQAIQALRENPHEDPFVKNSVEMSL